MKYRIALWASAGLLVAACWALYAFLTAPSPNDGIRHVWTLVCLTCPVAIAGGHIPISLYWALAANAATYALIGLAAEALRPRLHSTK